MKLNLIKHLLQAAPLFVWIVVSPVLASGKPPSVDPCQWIPNPTYEACKAIVQCNTAPVGGTYCKISGVSFCNRVTDPKTVAEDLAKIAISAAICSQVPPANALPYKTQIALGQAAAACVASTARIQPETIKNTFCSANDALVDLCPGPKQINTCPWKN